MRRDRMTGLLAVALAVYVMSLPFEVPNRPIPIEVHTLTGAVLLLAALLQPQVGFGPPPAAFWWFAAYWWVLVVLGIGTAHPGQWLKDAVTFLQVLLIFWVTTCLFRRPAVAWRSLRLYVGAAGLLGLLQVLGVTASVAEVGRVAVRMTALGQNPNTFAHNMALATLVSVAIAAGQGGMRAEVRAGCAALSVVLLLAIMPTAARGALLSLVAGLAVLALGHLQTSAVRRSWQTPVGVALLVCGIGVVVYRSDAMRDRLVSSSETADLAQREHLFPAAVDMLLERPLLGWGPVNNRFELERRVPRAELPFRESHNMVLEVFTETGVAGGLPFLMGVALCVVQAWRARRGPLGALPLALIASLLVTKMGTAGIATKMHWLVLAVAASAMPANVAVRGRHATMRDWAARGARRRVSALRAPGI